MSDLNLTITIISILILISGIVLKRLEAYNLNEPVIAMAIGIFFGPHVLGMLDVQNWGGQEQVMEVACRITIGMALMATALRLPPNFFQKHSWTQLVVLLLLMPLMWISSAAIIYLVLGVPFLIALIVGAVVTPTDPVAAVSIVSGSIAKKILPEKIRYHLSSEAGANDGLAFPIVLFALTLFQGHSLIKEWLLKVVLWETIGGIIFGLATGYAAGKILHWAHGKKLMERKSLVAYSVGLAFFIIGGFELLYINSIVGVFAAGLMLNSHISKNEKLQEERVQESIERLFTIPIYFFLGLVLPFASWLQFGWKGIAVVFAILLFRRIPAAFAITPFTKEIKKTKNKFMFGWLGPIGVAAIFYAFYSVQKIDDIIIWDIASMIIFGSTIVHGLASMAIAKSLYK